MKENNFLNSQKEISSIKRMSDIRKDFTFVTSNITKKGRKCYDCGGEFCFRCQVILNSRVKNICKDCFLKEVRKEKNIKWKE